VEIVVTRDTNQEQAALLEQLERQQQQERQQEQETSEPPPPLGEDTPTRIAGRGGDLPMVIAEEQRASTTPVPPARSQRTRRPPGYLADYAVGHLELPPREGSPSSLDDYPILVENSLHYPREFHQEEGNSDRISEGTLYAICLFEIQWNFPRVA